MTQLESLLKIGSVQLRNDVLGYVPSKESEIITRSVTNGIRPGSAYLSCYQLIIVK